MVVTYDYTHDRPLILSSTETPHVLTRLAARATVQLQHSSPQRCMRMRKLVKESPLLMEE